MIRPQVTAVQATENHTLVLEFDNGEKKQFDVTPYIKGDWFGQLSDLTVFKQVRTTPFGITWPDGQDICPDDLYYNSTTIQAQKGALQNR